jgi:cell division protein FtsA
MGRAEELKTQHGSALVDSSLKAQTLNLVNQHGLPERSVNLEHLRRIMSVRLEETFQIIVEELDGAGALQDLRAGVFLCGGGARTPQIDKLAGRILGLPVTIGRTQSISGLVSALDQPEFATGIGLVKFGSFQQEPPPERVSLGSRLRATLSHVLQLS